MAGVQHASSLVNVWFGGPSGVHRAAFDTALAVGAAVGGPGLVVWGLGQPFERYAPPPEVALEHARQCAVRAHVLSLQWGPPDAHIAQIVHEAQRLGRPLRVVDLAATYHFPGLVDDLAQWLDGPRPHLYVVGGEQAAPPSGAYRSMRDLLTQVLIRFPRPTERGQ